MAVRMRVGVVAVVAVVGSLAVPVEADSASRAERPGGASPRSLI